MKKGHFLFSLLFCVNCLSVYISASASETNYIEKNFNGLIYTDYGSEENGYTLLRAEDTNVTYIQIPTEIDGIPVMNIDEGNPFRDCIKLTEIEVAQDNPYFDTKDGVLFDEGLESLLAFPCAKKDTVYEIPGSTSIIGEYAFSNCNALETITISQNLYCAQYYAFYQCENLKNITGVLPVSNTSSFSSCKNLEALSVKGVGTSAIEPFYFEGFQKIKSLSIDENASTKNIIIADCPELEELTIPSYTGSDYGATLRIGGCDKLRKIYTDDSRKITIAGCPQLERIELNDIFPEENILRSVNNTIHLESCPALQSLTFYKKNTVYKMSPSIGEAEIKFSFNLSDCSVFTVYGYESNELLVRACEEAQLPFVALDNSEEILSGDVNEDKKINILDVIVINKAILGKEKLTDTQNKIADVNKNNKVDASDSLMIMKYIVGLINFFDV